MMIFSKVGQDDPNRERHIERNQSHHFVAAIGCSIKIKLTRHLSLTLSRCLYPGWNIACKRN